MSFHFQQRQFLTRPWTQEKNERGRKERGRKERGRKERGRKERGSCTSLGGRIDSHMRACQCVDVCVYVQYVYVCILVRVGVYIRKGVGVRSYMRA